MGIYRLEAELASTNDGERRYACVHERTGRRATLSLRAEVDDRRASRMLQQARAWARVAHPSINPITDMGVTDAGLYCVTSANDGTRTLDAVLKAGRLRDPLRTLLPIVHALAFAHAEGARHGALNASSIELVPEGRGWTARLTPRCTLGRARRRDDVRAIANLLGRCNVSRRVRAVLARASTMSMLELYDALIRVSPAPVRRRMDAIAGARDELVSSGSTTLQLGKTRTLPFNSLRLGFMFVLVAALSYGIVRSWIWLGL